MPATTFGIVYATGSKMVRRIILPDDDTELLNGNHVGPGETMLVSPSGSHDLATCQALVKQATGVAPPDAACAVLDKNNAVVAVIMADPAIDTHPAGTVVKAYGGVCVGCTYDLLSDQFTAPSYTIPAGIDKITRLPTLQQDMPARVIAKPIAIK